MKPGLCNLVLILIVAVSCLSCSRKSATYEVSNINGKKVITNTGEPANPDLKAEFKPVLEIQGYTEEQPDENTFFRVTDVSFNNDKYYIWNAHDLKLYIFDDKGLLLKSKCFKGSGPGEFEEYAVIHITDYVYLFDNLGKIVILDKNIELVRSTMDFTRLGQIENQIYNNSGDDSIFIMGEKLIVSDSGLKTQYTIKKLNGNFEDADTLKLELEDYNLMLSGEYFKKMTVINDNELVIGICNNYEPSFDVYDKQLNFKYTFKRQGFIPGRSQEEQKIIVDINGEESFKENPLWFEKRVWRTIGLIDKYNLFVSVSRSYEYSTLYLNLYSDGVYIKTVERKYSSPEEVADTRFIIKDNLLYECKSDANNVKIYDIVLNEL